MQSLRRNRLMLRLGSAIEKLCECALEDSLADRGSVVRAARCLLGSVTKVLLLADIVVVNQLLHAKDKVARSLGRLESVSNFTEFVKAFSQFGGEMVELAHLTGDRQVRTCFLFFLLCLQINISRISFLSIILYNYIILFCNDGPNSLRMISKTRGDARRWQRLDRC